MSVVNIIAYAAVALNILGYSMRRMIPLRIAAISTNCLFIIYSCKIACNNDPLRGDIRVQFRPPLT